MQRGATLVRVHDVAATVDALKVWNAVASVPMPKAKPAVPGLRWPDEDGRLPASSFGGRCCPWLNIHADSSVS